MYTDTMTQPIRETARAVILQDDRFLLIRRTRQNSEGGIDNWLSIPGGGIDLGETPEQAVTREVKEELGVIVDVVRLLVVQEVPADASRHYYFLCTIREGEEPRIQEQSEEYERMQGNIPDTYAVEWTRIDSPTLSGGLFWAYAEAYSRFSLLIESERGVPLRLRTDGDALAPRTIIVNDSAIDNI